MRKLRRRLRAASALAGYLLGVAATAYGLGRIYDGHYPDGPLLLVGGILLCLPHWLAMRFWERRRREQMLLLCVRVHPGHAAAWIGRELGWKPGRLYPMLDRLVEAGELHREPNNTYWTMAAPKYDPNWAAKREAL